MSDDDGALKAFVYVVFGPPLVAMITAFGIALGLWWAWWLYPAWAWFVVPLGAPPISLWHFWALRILLVSKMVAMPDKEPKEAKERGVSDYAAWLLINIGGPVMGWALLKTIAGAW